jgi:hypothetical protein
VGTGHCRCAAAPQPPRSPVARSPVAARHGRRQWNGITRAMLTARTQTHALDVYSADPCRRDSRRDCRGLAVATFPVPEPSQACRVPTNVSRVGVGAGAGAMRRRPATAACGGLARGRRGKGANCFRAARAAASSMRQDSRKGAHVFFPTWFYTLASWPSSCRQVNR